MSFLVYNGHYLSHIGDGVANYGNLDRFSSFPFATYLNEIKCLVKLTVNLLAEIHNRLFESNACSLSEESRPFELKQETLARPTCTYRSI